MNEESRESPPQGRRRLERAIVLELLRDDREATWSAQELLAQVGGSIAALQEAVARLEREGVVSRADDAVAASRAARWLDELELIAI